MEAVDRRRENVLLGYAPRDPFSGEEMKPKGGTDFSDVFGGPPRRYSVCENRSSLEDRSSLDSEPGGRLEREDSMEKPVFGGLTSPAHRRRLGGDFFDDIFGGSDSPSSTPRKLERDRVTFTPSTSFRSPFRPLPPATDIFSGESEAKSPNLSYSSRLAKTFDYSPHKPPTPRTSRKEDQKASATGSPIQPSIPTDLPVQSGETKISESPKVKEESNSKDKILIEDSLHFSMYKWASKGVTLVLPPNLKDKSKGRSRLGIYAQVSQEPNLPLDKENLPKKISPVQKSNEPEDVTVFYTINQSPTKAHIINPSPPKVLRDITDLPDDSGFPVEMKKPKNLHQLIDDELKTEGKDYPVADFKKPAKTTREDKNPNYFQRSKSKVKESVKNFEPQAIGNRESTEAKIEEQRQGSKMAKKDENKLNYQVPAIPVAPKSEEERAPSADSVLQRKISSTPVAFSVSRKSVDISFCEIDVADFEVLDDFMVEDLPQESNEDTQASSREDEIKEWDAKIREWSRGRQGNIRSLLSTLQHVLWLGSGWKPVKLMDIIEGPSVKRAYQRALLHLHPDKLQQKGADMHHKYIAEKVFDILQEAWNQFNALGAA